MNLTDLTTRLTGPPLSIHLLGVAGSGMSGIAALLLALGHHVSGSDKADTVEIERLKEKGLKFSNAHDAAHVADVDLVIYSSAIKPGNPAFDEAQRLQKPLFRRADALASIMAAKKGIIVSGMHGKTTTSSMCAHVFRVCGLKPSHYVGAEIPVLGTNAQWDAEGEHFVAEGDESDGTLINYHPEHAIVLNIEPEHLDFYKDLAAIDAVYSKLTSQTGNKVVYCGDDPGAARICSSHPGAISYGFEEACNYHLQDFRMGAFSSTFDVWHGGKRVGEIQLNIPGRHNALNALAVIALALEIDLPFDLIAEGIASFRGAKRRFEVKYESSEHLIVDDYGHHPSEIAATLATARNAGRQHVIVLFQPHRYSRTLALKDDFGRSFKDADTVFITEIYAASEKPLPGISGQTIVDAIKANGHQSVYFEPDMEQLHKKVGAILEGNALILTLGAGNIHECGTRLAEDLAIREKLLKAMGGGSARLHEPLAKHTTLKVGGPAQFWVEPFTEEEFAKLVRYCFVEKIPFMVMGRGSNLLVRDGGILGVVVHLSKGEFARHKVDGMEITVGVGVKFKQLSTIAQKAGIGGFEWMEGIPGNIGGGLRMNAGAMGSQTFDQVVSVRYVDQKGNITTKAAKEIEVHYRDVPALADHYAVSATFHGQPSSAEVIDRLIKESQTKRREGQPIAASAGCIFKNPKEIPAGKLVEELGFKNFSVGHARVSEVHGNFIVNDGDAKAEEILSLIEEIKVAAMRKRGIELETEVQIVGENNS
ncbi:MAG: UDP-N-acetylmuramate--L-alanine ligase [Chthoniobacterales bacterium]